MNIAKCLDTAFYTEPSRSLWFSEIYVMIELLWMSSGKKLIFFTFLNVIALFSFVTPVLE